MLDINTILNNNEEVEQFFNEIKSLDIFQQAYLFRRASDTSRERLLSSSLCIPFFKFLKDSVIDKHPDEIAAMALMCHNNLLYEDVKDFIENGKIFILNLKIDQISDKKNLIFLSLEEAEDFVTSWGQLSKSEKVIKFVECFYKFVDVDGCRTMDFNRIDRSQIHGVISTEFFRIHGSLSVESVKRIQDMVSNDRPRKEIEKYLFESGIIS